MNIGQKTSKNGEKIHFFYDYGRGPGQRPSTGIFIYANPQNQEQRNFNKQALKILDVKKGEAIIEQQVIGTGLIPQHKFKANFLDYYEEYMKLNTRDGNRHLSCCFSKLKLFIQRDFLAPVDITENFCKRFRRYLLDNLTGETPANYYARFKWVIDSAAKDGYFRIDPTEDIPAIGNPSVALKENLEVEEYMALLKTPWVNQDVKDGFIFSCYTGLRACDVRSIEWSDLRDGTLTTRIIQRKTGLPVLLTLHPIAQAIIDKRRKIASLSSVEPSGNVFYLPSQNGANDSLEEWMKAAGINKHITWSCARLSFSILLQDKNVDDATVAYLMGHATTKQVQRTYKRHRPKDQRAAVSNLPTF